VNDLAAGEWQLRSFVLRRAREVGLSVADVAQRAGLTRQYLYKLIDGGTHDPGIRTLHRLAQALEVAPVVLFRHFIDLRAARRGPRTGVATSMHDADDAVAFAADLTMPDHAPVAPGERFTKTWAVQNVGTVAWQQRRLARADDAIVVARRLGDGSLAPMVDAHLRTLQAEVRLPDAAPGDLAVVSVDFEAPHESCSVASVWRIVDGDGRACYPPDFFLQVVVTVLA
jgi:transcriptional regulator with XRE-family HTH domain